MHSIEASVLVNAPVEECYQRWMEVERFPEFMHRVVSVHRANLTQMDSLVSVPSERTMRQMDPQADYDATITGEVLHEVAAQGNQVWRWEVKGPLGQVYSWTAGIVQNLPNKVISWASTASQDVPNTGATSFSELHDKRTGQVQTLVEVKMSFSAPYGPLGEWMSDVAHYGDTLLSESLNDFKHHVEQETGYLAHLADETKPLTGERHIRKAPGMPPAP